jgi:CCDC81-like HU domain protein/sporulation related protein
MNIQQLIIKGIKEQLFLNNYLVLPNFGGFVLRFNPSHFSGAGTFILPPSKTVSFNSQLKQNDGLLAMWLQAKLNCTAAEALTHLHEFAEYCSGILTTRRRLSLDTIGFFYLDFENNICFEPQQDGNFLTKSFGLAPVSIKELEPEIRETKKETVFVDRTVNTESIAQVQKQKRNYSRALVPAVLMIVFLSGLLMFVSTTKFNGPLQASVFSSNGKSTYMPLNYPELVLAQAPKDNDTYVADANGIATITLENNKTLAVKALNNIVNTNATTPSRSNAKAVRSSGKFEIVLGCFTVLENANRMLDKLSKENIGAFVSKKNNKGMYVVVNDSFATKDSAITGLAEIKRAYPKAWIKQPD